MDKFKEIIFKMYVLESLYLNLRTKFIGKGKIKSHYLYEFPIYD